VAGVSVLRPKAGGSDPEYWFIGAQGIAQLYEREERWDPLGESLLKLTEIFSELCVHHVL